MTLEGKIDEDYESYDVLKQHKIRMLQVQIEQAISRKYRISFAKGLRIVYEQLILFVTMMIIMLKANIYSLIYLLIVIKYMVSTSKISLLTRLVSIISTVMIVQYSLYLTNLTAHLSPVSFPE